MTPFSLFEIAALVPTVMLFLIIFSQYVVMSKSQKKEYPSYSPPISIIVPAHNEGKYIHQTVDSLLKAKYPNKKQIIVVNDGSTDQTASILKSFGSSITTFKTNHIGKSRALNEALKRAIHNIIIVIDGDSSVESEALIHLVRPLQDKNVAAVGGIVKIKNKKHPISWFQTIEYLHSSFFNSLCDRINGNIFTPGPLSAFKKDRVEMLGGFNTSVFLEDVDMSLRLIRDGNTIRIAEKAFVRTNVPDTVRSWMRQRKRWMKGGIEVIKNHRTIILNKRFGNCGFYPLPILSYWYFHSIIMGIIIFAQIIGGYYQWFYLAGDLISLNVVQYFLYWFSFLGILNLAYLLITGLIPAGPLAIMSVIVTALAYPIYLYGFRKFNEPVRFQDIIALFFIFPYWILVLIVQVSSNIHWLIETQRRNWWTK